MFSATKKIEGVGKYFKRVSSFLHTYILEGGISIRTSRLFILYRLLKPYYIVVYIFLDFIQKFFNPLFHRNIIFGGSLIQQLMKEFDSDETE